MRRVATALVLVALAASPLAAQNRGRGNGARAQGIPPGQMPPAGQCRVWYEGRPPGQQPRATSCDNAERLASRDPNARVIYGSNNGAYGTYDRSYPDYGSTYPYPDRSTRSNRNTAGYGYGSVPFDNGYQDGLEKGREDARDNDSYDPVRHSRYRSADHGYNSRYGTREQYKLVYRDGFEAGYVDGYRNRGVTTRSGGVTTRGGRFPWPF